MAYEQMPGLGQGIASFGGGLLNLFAPRDRTQDVLTQLYTNLMTPVTKPAPPAEGQPEQPAAPDPLANMRAYFQTMYKGAAPSDLAKVMGAAPFTPQGFAAINAAMAKAEAPGVAGPLIPGEALRDKLPNANLTGAALQQDKEGRYHVVLGAPELQGFMPGEWVRNKVTGEVQQTPLNPIFQQLGQGAAQVVTDPNTMKSAILMQRAPAPQQAPPNQNMLFPSYDPTTGATVTNLLQMSKGRGNEPGQVLGVTPLGPKAGPKPLPEGVQKDFNMATQGVRALNMMEKNVGETGLFKGQWSKLGAATGLNQGAIDFQTGHDQSIITGQALQKGPMSDLDTRLWQQIHPELGLPESVNRARIAFLKQTYKDTVATKLGYYKGANYQIPIELTRLANSLGIDPEAVSPLTESEMGARIDKINNSIDAGTRSKALGFTAPTAAAPAGAPVVAPVSAAHAVKTPSADIQKLLDKYAPQ